MPYGTDPFIDGSGDYKQPTIIDYDKRNNTPLPPYIENKEEILSKFEKEKEEALNEVLSINPVYGGLDYNHLTSAVNGKLVWNTSKINELKDDTTWLYNLLRYLRKKKNQTIYR